jgi:hypothetical protein
MKVKGGFWWGLAVLLLLGVTGPHVEATKRWAEQPVIHITAPRIDRETGELWQCALGGNEILNIDKNTGKIKRRLNYEHNGVQSPDDMVFHRGKVYYTDICGGRVRSIDLETGHSRIVVDHLPAANPINVARDPVTRKYRMFVGADFFGDGLFEIVNFTSESPENPPYLKMIIEPTETKLWFMAPGQNTVDPTRGYPIRPMHKLTYIYYNTNGFDIRKENGELWLYTPLVYYRRIIKVRLPPQDYLEPYYVLDRIDPTSDRYLDPGNENTYPDGIQLVFKAPESLPVFEPYAVRFNPQDKMLYSVGITKEGAQAIKVLGQGVYETIATFDGSLDNLDFDAKGNLYVASNSQTTVYKINPVTKEKRPLLPEATFNILQGIEVDRDDPDPGFVYVTGSFDVRKLDVATGQVVKKFNHGPLHGELGYHFRASVKGDYLVRSAGRGLILSNMVTGVEEFFSSYLLSTGDPGYLAVQYNASQGIVIHHVQDGASGSKLVTILATSTYQVPDQPDTTYPALMRLVVRDTGGALEKVSVERGYATNGPGCGFTDLVVVENQVYLTDLYMNRLWSCNLTSCFQEGPAFDYIYIGAWGWGVALPYWGPSGITIDPTSGDLLVMFTGLENQWPAFLRHHKGGALVRIPLPLRGDASVVAEGFDTGRMSSWLDPGGTWGVYNYDTPAGAVGDIVADHKGKIYIAIDRQNELARLTPGKGGQGNLNGYVGPGTQPGDITVHEDYGLDILVRPPPEHYLPHAP